MKILFVCTSMFLSEPIGLMQLSAICKTAHHDTRLAVLNRGNFLEEILRYEPDLVAYSAMTVNINLFKEADAKLRRYLTANNKSVVRVMGGAHPTYCPDILDECDLDAVCIGEGDNAILEIVSRIENKQNLLNIPNVMAKNTKHCKKELIQELDFLPFIDRDIIYRTAPYYKSFGLRSFLASRGCPYKCSYCFNHVYNKIFESCGPIVRRRSVDHLIAEIKYVIKEFPPVRYIRFADDTFVHKVDKWLEEFVAKYKKEVGLPFYCLMRSNTMTEDVARMLSSAGCKAVSMSVETGNEKVRNDVLKRALSDEVVRKSFAIARKYKIKTYGNTMLGLPGQSLEHEFQSFLFVKSLGLDVQTFTIYTPAPQTDLAEYAVKNEMLDSMKLAEAGYTKKSILNCFTNEEKGIQARFINLAPVFCNLPNVFLPVFKVLLKFKLDKIYSILGSLFISYRLASRIFPYVIPRNARGFYAILKDYFWLRRLES
ncbi:MAG: radical SAM protein [Bacteroidales bacterium]